MHLSDFDYELAEELIAQEPLEQRDASRMLVLKRGTQTYADSRFELLPEYVRAETSSSSTTRACFPRG